MRLVIVGGVAGGASAAARARRLSEAAEIVVLERGSYPGFADQRAAAFHECDTAHLLRAIE